MFKKVLFICLSFNLLLIGGCIKATTSSDTSSVAGTQVLALNVPSKATNMRLYFDYRPNPYAKDSLDESCNIKEINQSSGTIIVNVYRHCINNGDGYNVTINVRLNNTIYRGMGYITKNNEVRNNHIIFEARVTADSDDDELDITSLETDEEVENSSSPTLPKGYEYIGKKTIDYTEVYILHRKGFKDICHTSCNCRELGKQDGPAPRPSCAGAIVDEDNDMVLTHTCDCSN